MEPEVEDTELKGETRQERRERHGRKKREKIPQHGRGLARVYRDAILKRLKPSQQKTKEG